MTETVQIYQFHKSNAIQVPVVYILVTAGIVMATWFIKQGI